ncbi:hypothetical protein BBBOND_0310550 [Babesia bigemina]|uniref:Uncharacterized protein n=1 Tax=Babesia bigemina TaxID=5866 RepID=A0A061DAY3_BABBI|nr:hypothetical protein BBBOND_0310550 [Babesia bigemina]CDR97152.1 hypothetical protein BBBOND_0310550 [Babesia bigemina]|eukprot:XP_012769338.1 hypothetical protein BBBOND_0310550 [Babesia bigemina]
MEPMRDGVSVEGTGRGKGRCRGLVGDSRQNNSDPTYKCGTEECKIECPDFTKCPCKCCKKKCEAAGDTCKAPGPQLSLSSSGPQSESVSQALSSGPPAEESSSGVSDTENPPGASFSPNPQAIAAVIVAMIVGIILLDLCIFRFPVGRNIRDFLVRKIPFCIAFYS